MLDSVARGIERLEAVMNRVDPNTAQALLAKLQAQELNLQGGNGRSGDFVLHGEDIIIERGVSIVEPIAQVDRETALQALSLRA
jgi:hypothetical protein